MPRRVNTPRAAEAAARTNPIGRSSRIQNQYNAGNGIAGDYRNSRQFRTENRPATGQRYGTRDQQRADIRRAFGLSNG